MNDALRMLREVVFSRRTRQLYNQLDIHMKVGDLQKIKAILECAGVGTTGYALTEEDIAFSRKSAEDILKALAKGKKWVGLALVGYEECEYTKIEEVRENESVQEAKERIIFSRCNWKCAPDEVDPEDRKWEDGRWDAFVFSDKRDVERLSSIDPPDYDGDFKTAIGEMMHCVYAAFADEYIPGEGTDE